MSDKPFAPAAEQNKAAILAALKKEFSAAKSVLEVGSGTGQHASHFCQHLRHLNWQTSDLRESIPAIQQWIDSSSCENLPPPIELDVNRTWPEQKYDAAFSANTAHIFSWAEIEKLFQGLSQILKQDSKFCWYGPFHFNGQATSESNARFDHYLRAQNPEQGVRDRETLIELGLRNSLEYSHAVEMPSNNFILVWRKL